MLHNKTGQNRLSGGRHHTRRLRSEDLNDHNVISMFESALTRMLGAGPDEFTDDIIIVQVYHFDLFKDLFYHGFARNGSTYRYFTSSAGQIRLKKALFIKDSVLKQIEPAVMCGLTLARINQKGGNNVSKYLAYMALINSAADHWACFDIDRAIVVEDFETAASGVYDYIDDETDGIYTSTHDLISKLLQFDVDGDKVLVAVDPTLLGIAARNMADVVPLYYHMKKAAPQQLNPDTIFAGLSTAFTGGKIGMYSNEITKIWNHPVFSAGSAAERQEAADAVKLLCCENNFAIDFAKTLYKPKRPPAAHAMITKYTRNLNLGTFRYQCLMAQPDCRCDPAVAECYDILNRKYRHMLSAHEGQSGNLPYVTDTLRREFARFGYPEDTIADMLTEYLYGSDKRYKQLLWFCYGRRLLTHLKANLRRSAASPEGPGILNKSMFRNQPIASHIQVKALVTTYYKRKCLIPAPNQADIRQQYRSPRVPDFTPPA